MGKEEEGMRRKQAEKSRTGGENKNDGKLSGESREEISGKEESSEVNKK